jgi:cob(I)alamin adenosyltransferase
MVSVGEGFTWETKSFDRDVQLAQRGWKKCLEVLHDPQYHLVIFDEINCVLHYNFLENAQVIKALQVKPAYKHVILTGRGAPSQLLALADLVSEIKSVKHPFDAGILAQPGIEY